MPDEIRINRPPQPQSQPQHPPRQEYSPETGDMDSGKRSKMPWIILGVVVVVLIVLGVLFRGSLFKGSNNAAMTAADATGTPSGYQAVFLTNGQVYFGKINGGDQYYVDMGDIYYLQVVQPPLQGNQQAGQTQAAGQTQPQISLVKLGNELHGPVDEMHISRSQILFYEDLKSDGQVVKAIMAYKASQSAPAAPAAAPSPSLTPTH